MEKLNKEPSNINNLLDRYRKTLRAPQKSVCKEAVSVIESVVGVKLKSSSLEYTVATRTLYIKAPSVVRQEVLRKKHEVLIELDKKLGPKSTPHALV